MVKFRNCDFCLKEYHPRTFKHRFCSRTCENKWYKLKTLFERRTAGELQGIEHLLRAITEQRIMDMGRDEHDDEV
jgi:hypothetical protein